MKKRLLVLLLAAAALAAGLAVTTVGTSDAGASVRLRAFGSCGELLAYAKRHATRIVGPYGLPGTAGPVAMPALPVAEATPDASAGATAGVDYSTTNVQEEGVDEPDVVKTDGRLVYAIARGKLQAVDVRGVVPRLVGTLALEPGWNQQIFLRGDRVLVFSGGGGPIEPLPAIAESIAPVPTGASVTEIDVSAPGAMRVVRTLTLEGVYLSARLTGSTVRLVVHSTPVLPFVYPDAGGEAEAEAQNRAIVAGSGLRNWLPSYELEDRATGLTRRARLVGCRDVLRPQRFAGLGTVTVLTIDLDRGLAPVDTDAVVTDGDTVYASQESIYVATQRWAERLSEPGTGAPPPGVTTAIHKFRFAGDDETEYRGSGQIGGHLLNQWSLSEHDGVLRVASTEAPVWWDDTMARESESFLTTLAERGGKLVQLGRVGGLGKSERVYSVRFIGETGYVVTFRQIDPLYVLDVSDPDSPRVRGELKIPGYSAYLHPVDDGLLLGVGQDATDEGRVLGTQVSLFDVSDPASPKRLAGRTIGQGWSEAEWDHHAFLYWPATRLAVLPVQAPDFAGAVGLRVGRSALADVGSVSHESAPVRRALVVGGTLYTVSEAGMKASTLAGLDEVGWLAFT
jgi:uncharacterized secreted protein with C-terminal beta-propeller domain